MRFTTFIALSIFLASNSSLATPELDPLFTDEKTSVRAPASSWPEDLGRDFVVEGPERAPASAKPPTKTKPNPKIAKAPAKRRSRLPANVADGVEIRVLYGNLTTVFWIVKRTEKFDLMYSNSSGSRASLALSPENFNSIHETARGLKTVEADISKCRNASMQMHVIANGAEKTVTTCVSDKSPSAEGVRNIASVLAAYVR